MPIKWKLDLILEGPTSPAKPFSESCDVDFCTKREYSLAVYEGQWYYISDSSVKKSTKADVLKSQAYILLYERVPFLYISIMYAE